MNLPGGPLRRSRPGLLELVPAFAWGDLSPGVRVPPRGALPPLLRAASLRSPAKRGQVRFRKAAASRRSPKRLRRGDHPATTLRRTTSTARRTTPRTSSTTFFRAVSAACRSGRWNTMRCRWPDSYPPGNKSRGSLLSCLHVTVFACYRGTCAVLISCCGTISKPASSWTNEDLVVPPSFCLRRRCGSY